jgi:hypothetical protein
MLLNAEPIAVGDWAEVKVEIEELYPDPSPGSPTDRC